MSSAHTQGSQRCIAASRNWNRIQPEPIAMMRSCTRFIISGIALDLRFMYLLSFDCPGRSSTPTSLIPSMYRSDSSSFPLRPWAASVRVGRKLRGRLEPEHLRTYVRASYYGCLPQTAAPAHAIGTPEITGCGQSRETPLCKSPGQLQTRSCPVKYGRTKSPTGRIYFRNGTSGSEIHSTYNFHSVALCNPL
jgi:hypothetical protein